MTVNLAEWSSQADSQRSIQGIVSSSLNMTTEQARELLQRMDIRVMSLRNVGRKIAVFAVIDEMEVGDVLSNHIIRERANEVLKGRQTLRMEAIARALMLFKRNGYVEVSEKTWNYTEYRRIA